jgi:crossover junction endodeoxyribonuclease RuvC
MNPLRILGIDPGLQLTGYGVVDYGQRPRIVDAGVIRLASKTSIAQRLVELEAELRSLIADVKPHRCAVEKLYAHYNHPRTAILMGHARGVILLCAQRSNLELIEISANRVKKNLTGNGHASKAQVQRSIADLFKLKQLPEPADVADALAIAMCAGRDATAR